MERANLLDRLEPIQHLVLDHVQQEGEWVGRPGQWIRSHRCGHRGERALEDQSTDRDSVLLQSLRGSRRYRPTKRVSPQIDRLGAVPCRSPVERSAGVSQHSALTGRPWGQGKPSVVDCEHPVPQLNYESFVQLDPMASPTVAHIAMAVQDCRSCFGLSGTAAAGTGVRGIPCVIIASHVPPVHLRPFGCIDFEVLDVQSRRRVDEAWVGIISKRVLGSVKKNGCALHCRRKRDHKRPNHHNTESPKQDIRCSRVALPDGRGQPYLGGYREHCHCSFHRPCHQRHVTRRHHAFSSMVNRSDGGM
eukprot:m.167403 g.167403  ORF g.167403 m.167403 type:complete len:304 (+) comp24099_c0_seq1:1867-2778(+)